MSPTLTPYQTRSSSNSSNTLIIIVLATVGGVLLIITAITVYIILRRRRSHVSQRPGSGSRREELDSSAASLLQPKMWNEEFTMPLDSPFMPPVLSHQRNDSTDSLVTVIPFRDNKPKTISTSLHPLSLRPATFPRLKPPLSPITIPSYSLDIYMNDSPNASPSSSTSSNSTESLYSQPSAASSYISTPPPQGRHPSPKILPLMMPRYAHVRTEADDAPARTDTRAIAKLLKKRAKRNQRKLSRSVSKIERAGSIRSAVSTSEENRGSPDAAHRSKSRLKSKEKDVPPPLPIPAPLRIRD